MIRTDKYALRLILLFIGIVVVQNTFAQKYTFKHYGLQEGICHPFTYTINQDNNGYLWIATGEGLCRYDGFTFKNVNTDSISSSLINVIYRDETNKLWFGFNDGAVAYYNGIDIVALTHNQEINSAIKGIGEVNGKIIVATLVNGIYQVNRNLNVSHIDTLEDAHTISNIHIFRNKLLVGAQEGLFVYTYDEKTDKYHMSYTPEELAYINTQTFATATDSLGVWVGTEDAGIYRLNFTGNTYLLKKVGSNTPVNNANIQHIMPEDQGALWISTYNGVFKAGLNKVNNDFSINSHFNTTNGLKTNFIKQVFVDYESNFWMATYEEGIAKLMDEALLVYTPNELQFIENITALETHQNWFWLGSQGLIQQYEIQSNKVISTITTSAGLPDVDISVMKYQPERNVLWVGTEGKGVYKIENNKVSNFFTSPASMGNTINDIRLQNDSLYLGTQNGIFVVDINTGNFLHYTTRDGLPYNDIDQLQPASNGGFLIATRSNGLYSFKNGSFSIYREIANIELQIEAAAYDSLGQLWLATMGNGLIGFVGDSLVNITRESGLKSDYCYGLVTGPKGNLWTGHKLGISRINPQNYHIKSMDQNDGIKGDVHASAIRKADNGDLLFGTNNGLVMYKPSKEKINDTPPFANIEKVTISDVVYDHHKPIELPYNAYKLRVDYLGINLSDPENVTYKYILEGYDLEWSDLTDLNYAVYPRVEDGEYTFKLKAFNSEGVSNTTLATFKLVIGKPLWKKWWFITLMALLLITIVLVIIKIRERRQKQLQEFLQRSLDERTREVVEQKEEIELKNRDITDSINYAQRIQESILPSIKRLQDSFAGSFVFYQPRDIVSGDFYWFDKVDNKFIVVCADSTGHGVPGAFMSMIGTTLIKDICMRPDTDSPVKTLKLLDEELSLTLNQNLDNEKPNDGMDIVVCEIDMDTNMVRFASAMRPIIIYKDGEQMYIRGSRSSIGGQSSKEEKVFEEANIQLSKGDIIYMFSDGYPDQFGGPMGKKFKMVRLKNLLRDIHQKPMEEQYNYVKSTFNLWKEDLDQVDDVLFMGIKF